MSISLGIGLKIGGNGGGLSASEIWVNDMLLNYKTLNNHSTFTPAQEVLIRERLEEDYIVTTFGPDGADKTVCDFFLFFENSNTTSNLTTRTNTKTGDTLRWNYGAGNIYDQNNLPPQTTNGVVTVTSTDGFAGWTIIDIQSNTFINHLPSLKYLTAIYTCYMDTNGFTGTIPEFNSTNCYRLLLGSNNFTSINASLATCANIQRYDVHNNPLLTGTFPVITGLTSLTEIKINTTLISGKIPDLTGNTNFGYLSAQISHCEGMAGTFGGVKMTTLTFCDGAGSCYLSTAEVGSIINKLAVAFTANAPTVNLALTLSSAAGYGIGALIGDEANTDLIALRAAFATAGKTLTLTYNAEATRFAAGHIIFSNDDGFESVYTKVLPLFTTKGITGTFHIVTDWVGTADHATWANLNDIEDAGNEIASHGKTHTSFTSLSDVQLRAELDAIDIAFPANGLDVPDTIAYPSAAQNATIKSTCAEYYSLGRVVSITYITPVSDKFIIGTKVLDNITDATLSNIKYFINAIYFGQCSGVILFHKVVNGVAPAGETSYEILEQVVDHCLAIGVDVMNFKDLAALMP